MNERLYNELSNSEGSVSPIRGFIIIFILCILMSAIVCFIGYRNTIKLSNTLPTATAVSILMPMLYYSIRQTQSRFLDCIKRGDYTLKIWTVDDKWTDKYHYDKYVDGQGITKREVNKWIRLNDGNTVIEIKFNCHDWDKVDIGCKLIEVSNDVGTKYIVGDFTQYA